MGQLTELSIPTADGRALGACLYEPATTPIGQVVVHGATATQQRYYASFARHLTWRGFRVLTYDYRGIGRSRIGPVANDPTTMRDWIDDAAAAQRWLARRGPQLPLLAIGHSFGGQIAAAIEDGGPPDGLLLVGAQSGHWRGFSWMQQPRMWLTWSALVPAVSRVLGAVPGALGLGEDLPAGVAQQWARWCLSRDYFLSELPWLRDRLAAYEGPVLALSFEDDELAPRANVQWLLDRLERARLSHEHIDPAAMGLRPVGHFGMFRATAADTLWPRAVAFLQGVVDARAGRYWQRPPSLEMLEVMADLQYGR